MVIRTPEGTIEISRGSFDDPWDIDASVSSRGFSGAVTNIFPMSTDEFFAGVRRIEQGQRVRAELHGTEDFLFALEPKGGTGAFWAEIQLTVISGATPGGISHQVRCKLAVDGENWYSTIQALRKELVGYSAAGA